MGQVYIHRQVLHILCVVHVVHAFWINMYGIFQSAVGHEYTADLAKHASQTDAAKGFGGKYGVQQDRKDKVRYETIKNNIEKKFLIKKCKNCQGISSEM